MRIELNPENLEDYNRFLKIKGNTMTRVPVERTALTIANSKSRSLRATVPASIVRHFDLSDGDELEWDFETRDNRLVVVVRPAKARGGHEQIQ